MDEIQRSGRPAAVAVIDAHAGKIAATFRPHVPTGDAPAFKTVEAHRANIMKKLRVSNAAQLLREALEGGYVHFRRAG